MMNPPTNRSELKQWVKRLAAAIPRISKGLDELFQVRALLQTGAEPDMDALKHQLKGFNREGVKDVALGLGVLSSKRTSRTKARLITQILAAVKLSHEARRIGPQETALSRIPDSAWTILQEAGVVRSKDPREAMWEVMRKWAGKRKTDEARMVKRRVTEQRKLQGTDAPQVLVPVYDKTVLRQIEATDPVLSDIYAALRDVSMGKHKGCALISKSAGDLGRTVGSVIGDWGLTDEDAKKVMDWCALKPKDEPIPF